ncbi:MAG TPA: hypothetical protein VGQ76_08955 [Thermoanaerobaculia bacterium]|jgi:hypothetical protein|nr:hypothetical protein [Thermoanaerobaculia bacterium]
MSLQRCALVAGLLATLALAPGVFAVCLAPVLVDANVGTSVFTVSGRIDAPGTAKVTNLAGEPCTFVPITATVRITTNGAETTSLTRNAMGEVVLTATQPAEISNCYASSILATAFPVPNGTGTGPEVCWPGPRPGPIQISQLCPLILDLNGDGIHTTGLESPVRFWTFGGAMTDHGWTNPATQEAFLWLNSELDLSIDETELFGSRMPSPTGGPHSNGFQALEKYDTASFGGNGDGRITAADDVWWRLRLWTDHDHDGMADLFEVSLPSMHRIIALNLARVHDHTPYANGNSLMLVGTYVRRTGFNQYEERAMVDIGFTYAN